MAHTKLCLTATREAIVREYIRCILEPHGFVTIESRSSIEALQELDIFAEALDLIIIDLMLPDGDGTTLACTVRERCPTVAILLMTEPGEHAAAKFRKMFVFIEKPFSPDTLLRAVEIEMSRLKKL
jgi:DNA-binding response OmpR family regulator